MSSHPTTELDERYSEAESALPWSEAAAAFGRAELYWISTVRPDGRPHVTPLIAVWVDDACYITTGLSEQKAKNLAGNDACAITTGANNLEGGLDLVIEGRAQRITEAERLQAVADAFFEKYGETWHFEVKGDLLTHLHQDHGGAGVFEVRPVTAYGFTKAPYGHTRYRF